MPIFENGCLPSHVKSYKIPETATIEPPYIILVPINDLPTDYADNQSLADEYTVQVDCYDKEKPATPLARAVREAMSTIDMKQGTPVFSYDEARQIFRDGRRYQGKLLKI